MSKLIRIGEHWIDPNKVVSVAPHGGKNLNDEFFINVDMGSYTANYSYQNDPDGWEVDSAAMAVNEGRT